MTRNGVVRASVRLAASVMLLLAAPAMAAERALINFIGFDAEARYFAFEEYGEGDGAGGNYDNIYVVDLSDDSWVRGTPVRLYEGGDTDETPPLAETRAHAMAQVAPILRSLKIDQPASVLWLKGDGEHGDGKALEFFTPNCCGVDTTEDIAFRLTLTTFPITQSEDCEQFVEDKRLVGFALSYDDGTDQAELHRDAATLPRSRGCTLDYNLYAVVQPYESNYGRVAIVASWPFGFEGPDRRFLAVPIDSP